MTLVPGGRQKIRFQMPPDAIEPMNGSNSGLSRFNYRDKSREDVESMQKRLTMQDALYAELKAQHEENIAVVARQGAQLVELKEKLDETTQRLDTSEKVNKDLVDTCMDMRQEMGLLKDAAAGLQVANVALAVRSELDGGRFALALGLMIVFPYYFPDSLRYRMNRDSIRWHNFNRCMAAFYDMHLEDGVQVKSIFSTVDENCQNLIPDRDTVSEPSDAVMSDPIDYSDYADYMEMDESEAVDDYGAWGSDEYWMTRLRFVAPAMIWVYSELRRALLEDYDDAAVEMNEANAYKGLINEMTGAKDLPFPSNSKRINVKLSCRVGSGYRYRMDNSEWRALFANVVLPEVKLENEHLVLKLQQQQRPRAKSVGESSASLQMLHERSKGHKKIPSNPENVSESARETARENGAKDVNVFAGLTDSLLSSGSVVMNEDKEAGPNMYALKSYNKTMRGHIAKANKIQKHMAVIRDKFVIVLKCLTVLLDKNLLDCAILGSSYARMLTIYQIHKKVAYDNLLTQEAFEHMDVLETDFTLPKGTESFNHRQEHDKLKTVLNASDNYLLKHRQDVEESIDYYIANEAFERPTKDLGIFFEYCDWLVPIPGPHENAI